MAETPNPENRKRIVDDAIRIVKERKPDAILPPERTELDLLMDRVEASARKVYALVAPIAAAQRDSGMPLDKQSALLLATLHRFWVDELMQYNRDELLFICALVHAHTMRESFV